MANPIRRALEEIRNVLAGSPKQAELKEEVEHALSSEDEARMRKAMKKFDALETVHIQAFRKDDGSDGSDSQRAAPDSASSDGNGSS